MLDAGGRDGGPAPVDVVLRWLVSFVGSPGAGIEEQARVIVAGMRVQAQPQLQF